MKYCNPQFEGTNEDPEYESGKVLFQIGWDGNLPIDLLEICDMFGLECIFGSDPSMAEEGTTKFCGEGDFYVFINTHNTDCVDGFSNNQTKRRRQRFTLAHELAHCTYKSHSDLKLQQNLGAASNPHAKSYIKVREDQANQFAAHLLVPRKAFKTFSRSVSGNDIATLIQLASEQFDVSLEVAAQQASRLADYPCITILFDKAGIPKRTPVYSSDFQETRLFYPKNQDAPKRTAVAQMLSGSNQNQKSKKRFPDASIWFPEAPDWKAGKFSVVETSISTGEYGFVTFLEINDNS
jgi:hypothetical protein